MSEVQEEPQTVWVTKFALTKGILEKGIEILYPESMVRLKSLYFPLVTIGRDAFFTREEAITRADEMRAKKIASLKRQIKKLEGMKFE